MDNLALVEADNVSKTYCLDGIKVAALDGVTFSVRSRWFLGITGPSGSGKSTLLNLLAGLDRPTSGTIAVQGKVISELSKDELALYRRHQVGMIFQSFNLIASYTALENVALPLLFSGVAKKQRKRLAAEMLNTVGLYPRKDHRPSELSGGEQQRVAIARALVNQPKIVLADEPTGNLDSKTAEQIVETLAQLNAERSLTVIMISHEEFLLRRFADRIVRLRDGRIIESVEIK